MSKSERNIVNNLIQTYSKEIKGERVGRKGRRDKKIKRYNLI